MGTGHLLLDQWLGCRVSKEQQSDDPALPRCAHCQGTPKTQTTVQLHEADTGEEGSVSGNAAGVGGSESLRVSAPWGEPALFSRSGSTGANGHLRLKVLFQRMDPPRFYGKETPIHQPDTTIPIESDSYSLWVLLH